MPELDESFDMTPTRPPCGKADEELAMGEVKVEDHWSNGPKPANPEQKAILKSYESARRERLVAHT
jgi:hypothetical protein